MSPLARSLLALAALLAAADAMTNPFCDSLSRREQTDDYETFVITGTGDSVTEIPDKCTRPGRKLVGDYLSVCNAYHRPKLATPMGIAHPLGAVYITCPKTVDGCSRLQLHVTQYCKMVTGPTPLLLG
ncbi:uncharacterized protein LOC133518397 [Cydia pomonella]|uniref:uncharacterized protein LOC133518397 n=1 Tax=Cydia pomonella TaxID=82600 RepID=UPI002ADDF381|nr:uncharacterized protein LOC133518397 [Cydia pomonella]